MDVFSKFNLYSKDGGGTFGFSYGKGSYHPPAMLVALSVVQARHQEKDIP